MKVLVIDAIAPDGIAYLSERGFQVDQISSKLPKDELLAKIGDYEAIVTRSSTTVTAEFLARARRLRILGRAGVGVDNIDVDACSRQGVVVVNAPYGNVVSAAEHTIGMLLALVRKIPQANASLKQLEWDRGIYGSELHRKTAGVLGLGKVGSRVAARLKAFDMEVLVYDPYIPESRARDLGVRLTDFATVLARSDIVTVHVPLNEETENMIAARELGAMKPGVRLVNPVVRQQGFASKGGHSVGVAVVGADPVLQDGVTPVSKYMVGGRYHGLGSDEIVVDTELAKDLNFAVGDRIRLSSNTGASDSFTIVGIYSRGQGRGDAYVTLRTAQSLFGLGMAVNVVFVKLADIYRADEVADRIMAVLPYEAKSWSREFPSFLDSLRMQTAAAYLISVFSLVASSFAIASVLIVSVLQKSKQIGILKAIGARRRQILVVFILEGLGVAVVGSAVGATVGTLIIYLLGLIEQPAYRAGQLPEQFFPVAILPGYIALAVVAAIVATVLAAYLPARQAAKLNPVDVMR